MATRSRSGRHSSEEGRREWSRGADAYAARQAQGLDYWRTEFFGPYQVKVCGDVAGLQVLDVGCGAGYLACELANAVYVIDPATLRTLATIPAGRNANGIAVHPDGRSVYVSNGTDGSVMRIDTASNTVNATIAVGKRPWNMAITPDGSKLYVANGRSNSVSVIDTASARKLADMGVSDQDLEPPAQLELAPRQPQAPELLLTSERSETAAHSEASAKP